MKRTPLLLALAAALALPASALAKGPALARINGPGLKHTLLLRGAEGTSSRLSTFVELVGFFPATYGQSPDPMLKTRPRGAFGPRYRIIYTVPGPNGASVIRQDVYPYAKPVPVSYLRPNQPFWGTQKTYGGWFVSSPALKVLLVDAGLPAKAPAP